MYEGYNIQTRYFILYWTADYVRKVMLALVVVIFQTTFWLQMTILFVSSLFILMVSVSVRTRMTTFSTRMDSFNEIKILVIMYHMMLFTMAVPDPIMKSNIGYSASFFLVLGTIINMYQLVMSPIIMTKRYCIIKYAKRKARKMARQRRPDAALFAEKRGKFIQNKVKEHLSEQERIQKELADKE